MDSQYIESKLSLLPRFSVERLEAQSGEHEDLIRLYGRFSKSIGVEDQSTYFYLPDLRSIYGLLLASTVGEQSRCFEQFWTSEIENSELVGSDLYYFAAYDEYHFRLAIDPDILWEEVKFASSPALSELLVGTDGKNYRRLSKVRDEAGLPADSKVVPDGWDHEHCTFCTRHIYPDDNAYTSNQEEWVCTWCYRNAVEVKDPRPLLINYRDRV